MGATTASALGSMSGVVSAPLSVGDFMLMVQGWAPFWAGCKWSNLTDFLGPLLFDVQGDTSSIAVEVWGPVPEGLCVGEGRLSRHALRVFGKLMAMGCAL